MELPLNNNWRMPEEEFKKLLKNIEDVDKKIDRTEGAI